MIPAHLPNCALCTQNVLCLFLMVWGMVAEFWRGFQKYYQTPSKAIPYLTEVLLLNDNNNLELCVKRRHLWLVNLTAAKRLKVCRWKLLVLSIYKDDFIDPFRH